MAKYFIFVLLIAVIFALAQSHETSQSRYARSPRTHHHDSGNKGGHQKGSGHVNHFVELSHNLAKRYAGGNYGGHDKGFGGYGGHGEHGGQSGHSGHSSGHGGHSDEHSGHDSGHQQSKGGDHGHDSGNSKGHH